MITKEWVIEAQGGRYHFMDFDRPHPWNCRVIESDSYGKRFEAGAEVYFRLDYWIEFLQSVNAITDEEATYLSLKWT